MKNEIKKIIEEIDQLIPSKRTFFSETIKMIENEAEEDQISKKFDEESLILKGACDEVLRIL